jgi:hypothetical protein
MVLQDATPCSWESDLRELLFAFMFRVEQKVLLLALIAARTLSLIAITRYVVPWDIGPYFCVSSIKYLEPLTWLNRNVYGLTYTK